MLLREADVNGQWYLNLGRCPDHGYHLVGQWFVSWLLTDCIGSGSSALLEKKTNLLFSLWVVWCSEGADAIAWVRGKDRSLNRRDPTAQIASTTLMKRCVLVPLFFSTNRISTHVHFGSHPHTLGSRCPYSTRLGSLTFFF